MEINSKKISRAIVQNSVFFSPRQNFLIIENISWGLFSWGECDILIVSKKMFATEIEVKISISDLKADFKKKKWTGGFKNDHEKTIKKFYYAIPKDIEEKAVCLINEFNKEAGIIIVDFRENDKGIVLSPRVFILKNPIERKSEKLTNESVLNIARLAMFRYWKSV